MEHVFKDKIKCPYCSWEDDNSSEFTGDSGTSTCGSCGREFNVSRDVRTIYSTSRINCEENETEHDYQFKSVFKRTDEYDGAKGILIELPESEWTYTRIMVCSLCDDEKFIKITKAEYKSALPNDI